MAKRGNPVEGPKTYAARVVEPEQQEVTKRGAKGMASGIGAFAGSGALGTEADQFPNTLGNKGAAAMIGGLAGGVANAAINMAGMSKARKQLDQAESDIADVKPRIDYAKAQNAAKRGKK
jgi:hypothetical protein